MTAKRFFAPALFAVSTCLLAPAVAQEDDGASAGARQAAAAQRAVSIDFGGGRLSEFLAKLLRENKGLNVIASELAEEVPLPAFEIYEAAPETVLQALCRVVPEPYRVESDRMGGSRNEVFALRVTEIRSPVVSQAGVEQPTRVSVFSLRALLGSKQLDEALAAIDAGLGVADGPKPTVRFHEGSGLLFVHGKADQLNLVQQILMVIDNEPRPDPGKQANGSGR